MAWRSSGSTNEALVENLFRNHLITSARVKEAMLKVDRAHYAPTAPYKDSPQTIGHHATISAPHMHAAACESLLPYLTSGARVLDVGSGSGYLTHVLAELIAPGGKVVGIEHIAALVDLARANLVKSEGGKAFLEEGRVGFVKGDGRLGWLEMAPYDAIHVGAAAVEFHEALIGQLKAPGRLFMPVEEDFRQHIYVVDKDAEGHVTRTKTIGVQYVPLTDEPRG
ncbi:protein-L-isoaspartate O-methyltransferase-like protein [Acrodontium crateriforme]|uniref:Protein-L-isoaspartate O-methyltransferase n=1 Tax=Acrodontium crateriforme TaxID=150365 RepID=A0AAQ3R5Z4_9PEZI|nr:protein-L-isoaspartate O-methyltransferase-like protein [Acrodontium crateriforme]